MSNGRNLAKVERTDRTQRERVRGLLLFYHFNP